MFGTLNRIAMRCPERVLLVDNDPLTSSVLGTLLEKAGHQVVGMVRNGADALTHIVHCPPSMILLDLDISPIEGLTALLRILELHPQVIVLVVTSLDPQIYVPRCMRLGARGFLRKGVDIGLLAEMMVQARLGGVMYPFQTMRDKGRLHDLSDSELVLVRCFARKGDITVAAQALGLSHEKTEVIGAGLRTKLGLMSQEELGRFGRQKRLR